MQEQLVYLIGNAFRIYIYFKLLNTMFGTAKVKQIWIIIGFTFYFLINSFGAILFGNFTLNILTNIIPLIALSFLYESKVTSKLFVALAFYVVNMLADGIVYTIILIVIRIKGQMPHHALRKFGKGKPDPLSLPKKK